MTLLLLACTSTAPTANELPSATGPSELPEVLALPDVLPFTARTRASPITLVDQHGAPLLVLEALGVELEVERTLAERAFVRCTGCRAEVEGWVQKRALLPVGGDGATAQDALILAAASQAGTATRHGLVEGVAGAWTSPPWHAEGGYDGAVARWADGVWTVVEPEAEALTEHDEEGP